MAVQINGTTGITTPKLDALDLELGSKNVVESGSNANGEYVRFADGTQICLVASLLTATAQVTWTFPSSFASLTYLSASTDFYVVPGYYFVESSAASLATATLYRLRRSDRTATTDQFFIRAIAIGRWY